jgi:pyruvate dehydrogenase (quinone)
MACGYAKFTGRLGVCLATSGPGGVHLLNGLYDAKLDGAPVLAITGLQYHDLINTHTQQDVELDKLFMDVCVYNTRIMGPAHVENAVDQACRTALAHRGVAHVTMAVDFQSMPMKRKNASKRNIAHHTSDVRAGSGHCAKETDLVRAAEILNAGKKVAILAGRGALQAGEALLETAQRLGAPIIKALLGRAAVPDDSPLTTGGIGLLGTRPSQEAMEGCDTLLMVGTSFPYIEFYPKPGKARGIQIDEDPARIGLRYPVELGLVGDARPTLERLIPLLQPKEDRSFLQKAQQGMRDWWELMEERGTRMDKPMKPQVVAWELGKLLPENAITTCDSGTITTWWARQIRSKAGQMHSLSGNLATMACGLPYAIAAAIAFPNRPVVAFVGDGGLSMLMAELATCARYNVPVKVIVIKNNTLGQIKWEQMVFLGNPEYGVDLHPIDFEMVAKACGIPGYTIEEPKECRAILETALATPGPALIQAVVDANEPPMPGKIEPEQALKFAESLARGEPGGGAILKTVLRDKIRELV